MHRSLSHTHSRLGLRHRDDFAHIGSTRRLHHSRRSSHSRTIITYRIRSRRAGSEHVHVGGIGPRVNWLQTGLQSREHVPAGSGQTHVLEDTGVAVGSRRLLPIRRHLAEAWPGGARTRRCGGLRDEARCGKLRCRGRWSSVRGRSCHRLGSQGLSELRYWAWKLGRCSLPSCSLHSPRDDDRARVRRNTRGGCRVVRNLRISVCVRDGVRGSRGRWWGNGWNRL